MPKGRTTKGRTRATTAHIWNYFEISDLANKQAICKYCENTYSFKSTITNLKLHLNKKHVSVYEEFCCKETTDNSGNVNTQTLILHDGGDLGVGYRSEETNFGDGNIVLKSDPTNHDTRVHDGPMPTNSTFVTVTEFVAVPSASTPKAEIKLKPLKNLKQEKKMMSSYIPRNMDLSEKAQMDRCLLKLITIDLQPFNVVENEGFRQYTHALNSNYELPHRKTLANKLLPAEYKSRLQSAKQMLHDYCNSICLTADCWTSRHLVPYIAISGHFIHTETLEHRSILLQCSAMEDSYTDVKIAEELKKIADEWNITKKINFFVMDDTSKMVTAAHLLGWDHFGCYVHKLNLIVQEALNLQNIALIVMKVQKTVAHFKRSSQAKEMLLTYQMKAQNIPPECTKSLLTSMPTRWNSTFLMLQRFSELQEALRVTIPNIDADLPFIPMKDWQCIEQLIEVLKPVYEVTTIISAEKYLTASKAVVITQGLKGIYEQLSNKNYFSSIKDFVKCLGNGLNVRFMDLESNEVIGMCTYLDPRFKEHGFRDRDALARIKRVVIDKVTALLIDDNIAVAKENSNEDIMSVWMTFDNTVKSIETPKTAAKKAVEQVEMYVTEAVLPRNACPLQWWREHKHIYPSLFSLFIKHCNVMITSVPCERVFSKAGDIISDRRTRLTSSKISQIMFLNALLI